MTNPVTPRELPVAKPLLKGHLKDLREQGLTLSEMDKSDKSSEEIMDMVVDQLYPSDISEQLTGGQIFVLAQKCIELTYGDTVEKK